ncbi:MAG: hypothetical protein U1A06_09850 [Hoeflea sp.]|nr:hypothetical protein [Hoeflea sp.]
MRDLRPDVVFVIYGDLWRDFLALRDTCGDALTKRFYEDCVWRTRQAIRAGDPALALHWQRVRRFAEAYSISWVSAVEVDGHLIREVPKFSALRYPEDDALKRIEIGSERT